MQINKKEENDKIVIALEGRLDKLSSPTLETEIGPEIEKKKDIEFDLKDLQYISSAGLRILLATEKKVKENGKKMKLQDILKKICQILELPEGSSEALLMEVLRYEKIYNSHN